VVTALAIGLNQLICFLHGPGGSGKTTVIDLVTAYENNDFSTQTILVTAMTGVAAMILVEETTHSAVYLNQKKTN
jgi:ABC-type molybdenum transport system ATPase subunit/photorepair protein PhrA